MFLQVSADFVIVDRMRMDQKSDSESHVPGIGFIISTNRRHGELK